MTESAEDAKARIARIEGRMADAEALRTAPRAATRPAVRYPSYAAALEAGHRIGARRADDAALMALFCESPLPILVGAVSPQLVWEGAQAKELTTRQLAAMANRGWKEIDALQWI